MFPGFILSFIKPVHHSLLYLSLLHTFSISLLDGRTYIHTMSKYHQNEVMNDGDEWSMEVDLRSREKEKRTLHWFVRGKLQKGFIFGVPDRVEFAV